MSYLFVSHSFFQHLCNGYYCLPYTVLHLLSQDEQSFFMLIIFNWQIKVECLWLTIWWPDMHILEWLKQARSHTMHVFAVLRRLHLSILTQLELIGRVNKPEDECVVWDELESLLFLKMERFVCKSSITFYTNTEWSLLMSLIRQLFFFPVCKLNTWQLRFVLGIAHFRLAGSVSIWDVFFTCSVLT